MKQFILFVLLNVSLLGVTQEPFGKRFSITAQQGFTMVDYISTDLVGHNRASLNCVFGKSFMVGLDGNYTYATYDKYILKSNSYFNWQGAPQIRDISAGLSFYYFRNKEGGFAPSGRYFFLSGSYGISNKFRRETMLVGNSWNPTELNMSYLNKSLTRKSLILAIGFGRNFIVKRRMLLGYSCDFGLDILDDDKNAPFSVKYIMRPSVKIGYTF